MSLLDLGSDDNDVRNELLESIPIVNPDARASDSETDETTTIFVKVKSGKGFLARFRPAVTEKRYELDVFGTFVFRKIDHKHTVLDIVGLFKERFGMSRRESELGVVAFLKMLNQRSVINVVTADH